MMWHKARAQPTQSGAGRPGPGAFLKTIFPMCQSKSIRGVSNMEKAVERLNVAPGQVSWLAGLTSGPHAPNLWPEHRLTPINIPVLP
jgi:hypothetical protein